MIISTSYLHQSNEYHNKDSSHSFTLFAYVHVKQEVNWK